jgi:hypothetical protein
MVSLLISYGLGDIDGYGFFSNLGMQFRSPAAIHFVGLYFYQLLYRTFY